MKAETEANMIEHGLAKGFGRPRAGNTFHKEHQAELEEIAGAFRSGDEQLAEQIIAGNRNKTFAEPNGTGGDGCAEGLRVFREGRQRVDGREGA